MADCQRGSWAAVNVSFSRLHRAPGRVRARFVPHAGRAIAQLAEPHDLIRVDGLRAVAGRGSAAGHGVKPSLPEVTSWKSAARVPAAAPYRPGLRKPMGWAPQADEASASAAGAAMAGAEMLVSPAALEDPR